MMAGLYCLYFTCLTIISSNVLGTQSSGYDAGSCGGHFEISNETTILQLGTVNGRYQANESCTFHVFSTTEQPMIVTSEYFEIEEPDVYHETLIKEECLYDYMGIVDDGLETRYCGMEPLTCITSSLNNITVTFHSDGLFQYIGFKIAIQSHKVDESSFCNSTIVGDKYASDTISNSVLGTNCFYKIQAENEKTVQLTLQQIEFGSRTCAEESVIVYEGHSTHGKRLKEVCRDTTPQILPFRANVFFIEYRNPLNNKQEDAVKIKYEFGGYDAGTCGGLFEISNGATFLQLGTINGSYIAYERCTFHVFATNEQPMIVTSEYFDIEDSYVNFEIEAVNEKCLYDYMGIEDTGLETKYCGMEPLTYLTSSVNNFTVTFHSDHSFEYIGFKIAIQSQKVDESSFCNSTIVGEKYASDTISNSVFGTNCFYKIQAENEQYVQLTLQQIEFGSRTCAEESVIVYEGHSTHGKKLKVICSDTTPQVLPFHAHAFFIEYRNQLNNEQEGAFKIKYKLGILFTSMVGNMSQVWNEWRKIW